MKKTIYKFGIILILLVLIIIYQVRSSNPETIQIYKNGESLYVNNELLLEHVVDYALTSLEINQQHLLVLSLDRSKEIDQEGYEAAVESGHLVGGYVRVYQLSVNHNQVELIQIYENDFTKVNPWCIKTGKMEGNDQVDIFIGAYRATRYYEQDRRPFLLEWTGSYIKRRWTGSSLNNRTYYDAEFVDYDGDGYDELCIVQPDNDGELKRYYYKWSGFGLSIVGTGDYKY